jgi:TRAP-type C4-dicarboxylate transport system permease small subunit
VDVTRWRETASWISGIIAAIFLMAMMLLTCADVALRAFFNRPIRGVYDLVELLLAGTFFLAMPAVFLRDENILVNSIDDIAPRWVPFLKRAAELLAMVVLVVIAWQGVIARDTYLFNDVTSDLGLPRYWHWVVLLVGTIGSAIAATLMAVRRTGDR